MSILNYSIYNRAIEICSKSLEALKIWFIFGMLGTFATDVFVLFLVFVDKRMSLGPHAYVHKMP